MLFSDHLEVMIYVNRYLLFRRLRVTIYLAIVMANLIITFIVLGNVFLIFHEVEIHMHCEKFIQTYEFGLNTKTYELSVSRYKKNNPLTLLF